MAPGCFKNSALVRLSQLKSGEFSISVLRVNPRRHIHVHVYPTLILTNHTCYFDILCFKHTHLIVNRCKTSVKGKGQSLQRAKWSIRTELIPYLFPPEWDSSPSQGYPEH